jgi:hypothetical protein
MALIFHSVPQRTYKCHENSQLLQNLLLGKQRRGSDINRGYSFIISEKKNSKLTKCRCKTIL